VVKARGKAFRFFIFKHLVSVVQIRGTNVL
jgi:hypothetical protein